MRVGALGRHLPLWPQIHTHAHTHVYTLSLSLLLSLSLSPQVSGMGRRKTGNLGKSELLGDYMLLQVIRNGIRKTTSPPGEISR